MKFSKYLMVWCLAFFGLLSARLNAQNTDGYTKVSLTDMSFFKPTGKANWKVVADVTADLNQNEVMTVSPGTGVLVNLPDKENRANLLSTLEHGDIDVAFDFMMATHSNSGFYLQGRYEVQLLDSWGVKNPRYGDCGGLYRRRRLPDGYEYEGHAPRLNACKAPGLWQHMELSFQAPRFDASGKKIQNAKMLKVVLNGVTVQENVELTGPTGGPISEEEAATGAIMIQGDHGAVAFRNIRYMNFDQPAPKLNNLKYSYFEATFTKEGEVEKTKPASEGSTSDLTWEITKKDNGFGLRFTGNINVQRAGKYTFQVPSGGNTQLKVAGSTVLGYSMAYPDSPGRIGTAELNAGDNPFELIYTKTEDWLQSALGLFIQGQGLRKYPLHVPSSLVLGDPTNPILVEATDKEPTLLRSFMDWRKGSGSPSKRIVHAISVGYADGIHYTIDLDNGALAQVWRGGFLNATPMWNDRGDGSSRPLGSATSLTDSPIMSSVNGTSLLPDTLTADANFKFKSYTLNAKGEPTFKYGLFGVNVEDDIRTDESGKYFVRELRIEGGSSLLFCRLADGSKIEQLTDGTFAINDKSYYVKVLEGGQAKIMTEGGKAQLVAPVSSKIRYAIMF